jgi:hypothetical protein
MFVFRMLTTTVVAVALVTIATSRNAVSAEVAPNCAMSANVGNSPGYPEPIVSVVDARLVCPGGSAPAGWMTVVWRAGGRTAVCSAPTTGDSATCQAAIPAVSETMAITVTFEAGGRVYQDTFTSPGTVKQGGTTIRSAPAKTEGKIRLTNVYYKGIGGPQADEWIQFENLETTPIDMSGWYLKTQAKDATFIFPEGFIIGPAGRCRIYTNTDDPTWCGLNWNSGWEIWSDIQDVGVLFNAKGEKVARISYDSTGVRLEWYWLEVENVNLPPTAQGGTSASSEGAGGTAPPGGTAGTPTPTTPSSGGA